ncbi:bifunctional metallophosphatase/5'-nucleotidase [Spirochaetota bacterium]
MALVSPMPAQFTTISILLNDLKKERDNPVLVLDAGDFMMGSLYHTISREYAFELQMMKKMEYDVITLGNHDFDLMPEGLAETLKAGIKKGGFPKIVQSNIIFSKTSSKDDTLEKLYRKGIIKPYSLIKRKGIKIGIFGILGKGASESSPFIKPLKFDNSITAAKRIVKILKDKEKTDIIICLSHSGIYEDKLKSEDEILAREVNGIDIIISGHSHQKQIKPLFINNTLIVHTGHYGRYIGVLDILQNKNKVELSNYKLHKIDDTIKGDPAIGSTINYYQGAVNIKFLKYHGIGFMTRIAHTDFDLILKEDESNLGNLIADSIRSISNRYVYEQKDPLSKVRIAIVSNGTIRANLLKGKTGKITVTDLFRTIPTGIGMENEIHSMGNPILTFYLNAAEIKKGLEIITSVYPIKGPSYFLQLSGVKFTYNPYRMIFDRVTDILLEDDKGDFLPLDYSHSNKKLYRVAANSFSSFFINRLSKEKFDFLKIIPKDRNGNAINNLASLRVDINKNKEDIQELKEWVCFLKYLLSFPDINKDRFPDIPQKYSGKLGRIVKRASLNPLSLLKRGSYLTWLAFTAVIISLIIMGVIIFFAIKFKGTIGNYLEIIKNIFKHTS